MLNKLKEYEVLYITGNFGRLFEKKQNKNKFFEDFLKNNIYKYNKEITLLFPTHTWSLKENKKFDISFSKSETGVFTEWLRNKNSIRQVHPLGSLSAVGPLKEQIIKSYNGNLYGPGTPFDQIKEFATYSISVGLPPNKTSTIVHHIEELVRVSYRYDKEFLFEIFDKDRYLYSKNFNLYVWDENLNLKRNNNLKIFNIFTNKEKIEFLNLGNSILYGYDLNKFSEIITDAMSKDKNIWLD